MRLSRELSLAFHPSRDELLISRSSRLPTRLSFETRVVYTRIYIYISILLQATIPLITRLFLSFVYHTSRTKEDRLRETTCPYRKRGYEKREMCRARVERRRGGGGEQGKS